jgi:hypothetical protein
MSWQTLVNVNLNTVSRPGMCLWFAEEAVGAPHWYQTAREAWDNTSDKHPGDYNLPDAVVAVFWSWVGDLGEGPLDYGHVALWVPGVGLFSSPRGWRDGVTNTVYGSIDEVSNWLGASYLGWSSDLAGLQLSTWNGDPQPIAVIASNQRIAGSRGVFRRAEPTQDSERLYPDLEAGEIGNFVGYVHGENRDGNDIWFRGISGNYFWSGAFTDAGTDGLADLNAPAQPEPEAATPEHADPVEVIKPVEELYPELKQPSSMTEPKQLNFPKPKPSKKEKTMTAKEIANQEAQIAALPSVDLGVIIPSVKGRKIAYIVFALVAIVVGNIGVGFAAAGSGWPTWLVVAVAVTNNMAPLFAAIAVANASDKK